jgi:hypothetical protein
MELSRLVERVDPATAGKPNAVDCPPRSRAAYGAESGRPHVKTCSYVRPVATSVNEWSICL